MFFAIRNLKLKIYGYVIRHKKFTKDIIKNFDKNIIKEYKTVYPEITIDSMKEMALGFNETVIGQPHVMKHILTSIYGLKNPKRTRPVTLLF